MLPYQRGVLRVTSYGLLLERYKQKHGQFVRPVQGWESLDRSLWLAYSIGRHRGFSDAGTYNGLSRLPSGARSDHAVWPAMAFDMTRKGWTGRFGFGWWAANRYADFLVKHAYALHIEYVIVGRRIWSRDNGWRPYTAGTSHDWHVHVSGVR